MIIVISVIGILATVAIVQIIGASRGAQEVGARQKLETLNRAIAAHQESSSRDNLEVMLAADGAVYDEKAVLQHLQYRDPVRPNLGSPYVAKNYRPTTSFSTEDYRLRWTGSNYVLLMPGQAGSGLKIVFDGSDYGPEIVHSPGYKWGSR